MKLIQKALTKVKTMKQKDQANIIYNVSWKYYIISISDTLLLVQYLHFNNMKLA